MTIGAGIGSVLGGVSGIANSAKAIEQLLGIGGQTYFQQLQPASWRAVPFVTLSGNSKFGRRTKIHEYPYRDLPWVEDMGRKTRAFRLMGFIVGDDVIAQRKQLIAASEVAGPGNLVHPTFGAKTLTLIDVEFIEQWEQGRYFEVVFSFVEGGPRVFPTSTASTRRQTEAAAITAQSSSLLDFAKSALGAVVAGASVISSAITTALGWYDTAVSLVKDASNLFNLICQLPGDFGRFFGASASNAFQPASVLQSNATIQSLVSQGVENRQAVGSAAAALGMAAAALTSNTASPPGPATSTTPASNPALTALTNYGIAAQAVATALLNSAANPADAIRLLSQLAVYSPAAAPVVSPVQSSVIIMQTACAAMFRRAAIASLAVAISQYQPTSYNDAQTVMTSFDTLIDSEILIAADNGDDNTYVAFRALRQAVVADMTARGGQLAVLTTFSFNESLPALTLAQQIYQDPTRGDQLIAQAQPRHPAFMPPSFQALAT